MSNFDEKDLLTQELRERSAGVGGHPIGMDAVRGRARSIRRRRNAVRGAVAAMVATVAVPSGLAVSTALDSPDDGAPPPASTGSPSPDGTATPRPGDPVELTLTGLPQGDRADAAYVLVREKQLVSPAGTRDLAEAYTMMVPYNDGWIALGRSDQGFYDIVLLDADLKETVRRPGASESIVANEAGTQVAWGEQKSPGQVTLFNAPSNGADPLAWQVPVSEDDGLLQPVGFLDDDTVVYQTGGVDNRIGTATAGGEVTPIEGFIDISDASEANGLVAGRTSYDDLDGGSCSGVKEPKATTMLWERCELTIGEFSPDGRFVTATVGYYDNAAPALYVLDAATGETLLEFSPEPGGQTVTGTVQVAWEDDDSLLAVVVDGNQQGLVRASFDGSLELVAGPLEENDMSMRLWLADTPR